MRKLERSTTSSPLSRREFILSLAFAGLAVGCGGVIGCKAGPSPGATRFDIGICTSTSKWSLMQKAGCRYVEESVGKYLNPALGDAEFATIAAQHKAAGVPVRACNSFLPGELKLVGPNPRHNEAVAHATTALNRAKALGVQFIVLGSGGARQVPEGFSRAEADKQFIEVVGRIGKAAEAAGVTVAMESLNRSETNFGNTIRECLRLINAINNPRVRLTADMYHMLREDEGPDAILEAGSKIVHCHVAEKAGRTAPGVSGEDFKPYLRALKKIGFRGGISLECRWKDFDAEVTPAVLALKTQIDAVLSEV